MGLSAVCYNINQESRLKRSLGNELPNKAASDLMLLGLGDEDQEEV